MTKDEALISEIVAFVFDRVYAPLEKRLIALEKRPELKHCGVWHEKNYKAGSLVTHSGGLWLANKGTKQRPGQSGWTLIVKSGNAA